MPQVKHREVPGRGLDGQMISPASSPPLPYGAGSLPQLTCTSHRRAPRPVAHDVHLEPRSPPPPPPRRARAAMWRRTRGRVSIHHRPKARGQVSARACARGEDAPCDVRATCGSDLTPGPLKPERGSKGRRIKGTEDQREKAADVE